MKKTKVLFECIECGFQNPKLYGKCPQCGNWNSMTEVKPEPSGSGKTVSEVKAVKLEDIDSSKLPREKTGIFEFDNLLGGGMVPGSALLIGGEPGVGKSTLLMEISGKLSEAGKKVLIYSGEESSGQISRRAKRLKCNTDNIYILSMGNLESLKDAVKDIKPDFLIIDSIQTINSENSSWSGGTPSSLRNIAQEIIETAKKANITLFIVGHITKDGQIAGPKTLEHMVDVVLYFQGEIKTDLRILRGEKNRFGPVNEVGIFQMTASGLKSVKDPAMIFMNQKISKDPGISVFPAMKGMRSLLIEIQSLVTESPFSGNPRRISVGFDSNRMSMLISVIEKKLKLPFYKSDVFLNITGGMTLKETAADAAVAAALISSYKNIEPAEKSVIIGEIGLTGEIRPVSFLENRIKEAGKQGFKNFIIPQCRNSLKTAKDINIIEVQNIYDLYRSVGKKK